MDLLKEMIKEEFDWHMIDAKYVAGYVQSGFLTEAEYKAIVGTDYVA